MATSSYSEWSRAVGWCLWEVKGRVQGNLWGSHHVFSSLQAWPSFCGAVCLGHRALSEGDGRRTNMGREKEKAGWLEKRSPLWAQEPVCNSLCPNSQKPNLLQSFCGARGKQHFSRYWAATKLLQIQELQVKFLIKTLRPVVEFKWFAA